ncbi:MAG: MG321/MPN456 family lipoprotein, partial [Mycoplasma sp.]
SDIDVYEETDEDNVTTKKYKDPGLGIQFVDWISSSNVNLPLYEEGTNSQAPKLVRSGFYDTNNPNIDQNMRDWYLSDSYSGDKVNTWTASDPFVSSTTPWNPSFSQTPNTTYAQSVWTGLSTWSTRGNDNDPNNPFQNPELVSEGMADDLTDSSVVSRLNAEFGTGKLTFNIRAIPWVDSSGKETGEYLSPQDFLAGVQAFRRSLTSGINSNNAYFEGLVGINFDATINESANNLRNTNATETKPFVVHFTDPLLSLTDTLDILQKQYFNAIPAFDELVQNITDDDKFKAAGVFVPGTDRLDTQKTDWTKFYGCGNGLDPNVYTKLYSAAPYYISSVDQQKIEYKLNKSYFKAFDNMTNEKYENFKLTNPTTKQKRVGTISNRYAGSYGTAVLFNSFTSGEVDVSPISGDYFNSALKDSKLKSQIHYTPTKKINKSNVVAFNLQIYEKDGKVIIGKNPKTGNYEPMWDPTTKDVTYTVDEYGNYKWPAGWTPKIKSRVSQEYADLIAKDFYTPNGTSETIRKTLVNTVNWVSLKSLYSPGVTMSVQYSFMPFGVYSLNDSSEGTGEEFPLEYWEYAANKAYMTDVEWSAWNPEVIKKRSTGNMIWTYDELRSSMIKD